MTCPHLYEGYGLPCQRTDEHDPDARGGHTYATGSWVPDRHDRTSGGEH